MKKMTSARIQMLIKMNTSMDLRCTGGRRHLPGACRHFAVPHASSSTSTSKTWRMPLCAQFEDAQGSLTAHHRESHGQTQLSLFAARMKSQS